MDKANRRGFLSAIPLGAAAFADAAQSVQSAKPTASYTPSDYPIQPKRYSEVKVNDSFWKPRIATNAEVTIPFEVKKLGSESARGLGGGVLEAAMLSLATHANPALQSQVEARVQELKQAPPRGNGGFEIASTYFRVTGKRDLLDIARKSADALYEDFRLHNPPFSGGERDAINCIQLYLVTREKKHLDLAKHYLDIRGRDDSVSRSRHNQSYKPVLEQSEAVGHAVNWASLMVSLVDVGVLTGIRPYFDAASRMWQDAVSRKFYVTGGIGSSGNEGFGEPYSLPNLSAYCETCAVLMFITLNHRMFLATGDSKYIDVMERGMYNNALSGISQSGDRFFYVNRTASAGDGRDARWERASLECCPPNLVRFLALMPEYIYAQDRNGAVYVNLYVSSDASFMIHGKKLSISVDSQMPWGGTSRVTVSANEDVTGTIKLRIPGWANNQPAPGSLYSYLNRLEKKVSVSVNGKTTTAIADKFGYLSLDRLWKDGDRIELEFPVEVRTVAADPRVKEDRGRMACERGPIVYCAEWPDVEDGKVLDLLFDADRSMKPTVAMELYGGVTVIDAAARKIANPSSAPKPVRLIPYCYWANRGPGEMSVWLSRSGYAMGDTGPAGGFIFYENPNYQADGWRYLEAAPIDQSQGARWGCFRRSIPGARGTAIGTGKQNTADMLAACSEPDGAAALCANLSWNGVRGWFLPSRDELAAMYRNLTAAKSSAFRTDGLADNLTYWASSQETADMASHIDFADSGRQHGDDKDFPRRVRAIRAF